MNAKILALVLAFSGLGVSAGLAHDKIWVALYHGKNRPPPPEAILASEKMTHRLREVFGFKHYELIQAQEIELTHYWDQWAVPRKDFFIRVKPLPRQPGEPKVVDYEIYKDGTLVARGLYEPHEETPLFINGPDLDQGRLIFVLETR